MDQVVETCKTIFGWNEGIGLVGLVISGFLAFIAKRGLDTWKKQSQWKGRNDLAISVLRKCYQIETAFKLARNPWMDGAEIDESDEVNQTIPDENIRFIFAIYTHRVKELNAAYVGIEELCLESKVYFDKENVAGHLSKLISMGNRLKWDISNYLHEVRYGITPEYEYPTDEKKVNKLAEKRVKTLKPIIEFDEDDELAETIKILIMTVRDSIKDYI